MTQRDRADMALRLALAYWSNAGCMESGQKLVGSVVHLTADEDGYRWGLVEKVGDDFLTMRAMEHRPATGMTLLDRRLTVPAWKVHAANTADPISYYATATQGGAS